MSKIRRTVLVASTAIGLAGIAHPAFAAPAAEAAAAEEAPVGEIIVTANKRSESISKVGASVVAFDTSLLDKRGIVRLDELAKAVPNLTLAPSTHGTPVFTLRGIGFNSDSLGVYPAVSLSLDQAPMPFPVLANHSMYDLERVEVLKGPQGTLFGQNSTGGAINFVAAKPTKELQAGFNLDYGRFNEVHGSMFVSGPVSETVGVRLAVDAMHRDDWQYNFTRADTNGEQNYIAARLITDWQASDNLKFELNLNGSVDRSDPQALQIIASLPSNPAAPTPEELNAPLAPRNLRAANWSNSGRRGVGTQSDTESARPRGNRKIFQAFLRGDYNITDDVALTSITTYNHLKQNMAFDLDGSQYELVDNPRGDGTISDFNQELRVSNASAPGARFRWTVGANYNHSKVNELQIITYGANSLSNAGTNFIHESNVQNRGRMDNIAAFANGEYDFTDQLTFKAGIRYTSSKNKNRMCGSDTTGDQQLSALFRLLGNILGGKDIPVGPGTCISLNAQNLPGDPINITLKEDNVSWRAGLDFKASSTTLLYANISRGYKAGAFPVITGATQEVFKPAKQESVTSYEAGVKTRLLNNAVSFAGAVFYQDYRDKQIQGTVNTALFGLLQRLDNVPKSHIFGVEGELTVRPTAGLTLSGSASFLKTKVDEYSGITVFGVQKDFAGSRLPFAPSWSLVGDIDYRVPTSAGGEVFVGAGVNYRTYQDAYIAGSQLKIPDNGVNRWLDRTAFRIDGYALVDARIGYTFPGDRITMSAWGKNVFNTFNVQNKISYNNIITQATGMPGTYGVSLKVRLK
ncbi:TonB-dependent receptor [Novosphingobium sp. PASSN1]|uniref:TonB-dependent receptor n=1 Tax=Novosphingobium sp. PASSN1 TaxID=2015561 RepID=UPI000BCE3A56|nr:TonB-dependent receptor [Novosphingobium sp. PASSN1]OYU36880.1 MAG: TonB-dependent receptor [Novosphingobium sp. PASSN1]